MSKNKRILLAGIGIADITPAYGIHLAGDGMGLHRPAKKIYEPLFARVLIVKRGDIKLCLITADLLCITREYTTRIRETINRRYAIPPECVMVHVAQNHSAPSMGMLMLDPDFPLKFSPEEEYIGGAESVYCEFALEKILEATDKAVANFHPVEVGWAHAMRDGLAFNRRGITRDGKVTMPWFYRKKDMPCGPVHILRMEGPTDPEIGVVSLSSGKGQDIFLMNFACHPVNVFATDKYAVSGDWPGAWAQSMRKRKGNCIPMILNGCCGNLNPWPPFEPDFKPDYKRMGRLLGETGSEAIKALNFSENNTLGFKTRRVFLDYRHVPEKRKKEAEKILKNSPHIKWDSSRNEVDVNWFYAASTKSIELCRKRWPKFPYEIQVFRIGDAAIVGLAGEPFVEGQLEIKMKSPAPIVCVAHMCNQYVGYVPTRDAALRGGHEANEICTYWAKLAPDSLDKIVNNAKEMIQELFQ